MSSTPYYQFSIVLSKSSQIVAINVTCHENGMQVLMTFDAPFNGVIYAKGHYKDPGCRYVSPTKRNGHEKISFTIQPDECGTTWSNGPERQILESTVVVQSALDVQEMWDAVRRIRCRWPLRIDRQLHFKPLLMAPLDIIDSTFDGDDVTCWMDVMLDAGLPPTDPINVGETLSLIIHATDEKTSLDMHVKDCYAAATDEFENNETVIQLTDDRGCPLRPKLMGAFYKTREEATDERNASVVAFSLINAFAFPDEEAVYFTCHVVVCRGDCAGDVCAQEIVGDPNYNLPLPPPPLVGPPPQRRIVSPRLRRSVDSGVIRLRRSVRIEGLKSKMVTQTGVVLNVVVVLQLVTSVVVVVSLLRKRRRTRYFSKVP